MKTNWKIYQRCIEVINSCKTYEQTMSTLKYLNNAFNMELIALNEYKALCDYNIIIYKNNTAVD